MGYNKIFWLTGQSGAGKTTLVKGLKEKHKDFVFLDGDEMRESISLGAGFSREERKEHNFRVVRLAMVLARQMPVVVSVIAPMENVRKEIDKLCNPYWIYIKKDMPERENHFYEEPVGYKTIDNNVNSIKESIKELEEIVYG